MKISGKKGIITNKINQQANRRERKIKFLHEILMHSKREAVEIHDELMELLEEDDEDFGDKWQEEINFEGDDYSNEINEYLISRKDDPPSDAMSKSAIVDGYLRGSIYKEISTEGIYDLANQLNNLTIRITSNSGRNNELAVKEEKIKIKTVTKGHSINQGNKLINYNNLHQRTVALSSLARPYTNLEAGNPGISKIGLLTSNEEKNRLYYDIPTQEPRRNLSWIKSSQKPYGMQKREFNVDNKVDLKLNLALQLDQLSWLREMNAGGSCDQC